MRRTSQRACRDEAFKAHVIEYWNERATTYSNGIWDELEGAQHHAWIDVLHNKLALDFLGAEGEAPKVLDLGCGPGFFSILLSAMGCTVHAVDESEQMLRHAQENVARAGRPERVAFIRSDVSSLPLPSDTYDAVVLRNVTWLMRDPVAAYREWQRVLKPGGKLVVFDANWYTYLADAALDELRRSHQEDRAVLGWSENAFASAKQEDRCEALAAQLPLTYENRPAWDVEALSSIDFKSVAADEEVWRSVWTKGEQAFYATSPLFSVEAVK